MSYVGTIEFFCGTEVPENWLLCNGDSLPKVGDYEVLFDVIGYKFGGSDHFFSLPDLTGRAPLHSGNSVGENVSYKQLGQNGGVENINLTLSNLPKHSHDFKVSSLPTSSNERTESAQNNLIGDIAISRNFKRTVTDQLVAMNFETISRLNTANERHSNMPPFITMNFIICYYGLYPTPY